MILLRNWRRSSLAGSERVTGEGEVPSERKSSGGFCSLLICQAGSSFISVGIVATRDIFY